MLLGTVENSRSAHGHPSLLNRDVDDLLNFSSEEFHGRTTIFKIVICFASHVLTI
jgi:hypothetical protein